MGSACSRTTLSRSPDERHSIFFVSLYIEGTGRVDPWRRVTKSIYLYAVPESGILTDCCYDYFVGPPCDRRRIKRTHTRTQTDRWDTDGTEGVCDFDVPGCIYTYIYIYLLNVIRSVRRGVFVRRAVLANGTGKKFGFAGACVFDSGPPGIKNFCDVRVVEGTLSYLVPCFLRRESIR